MGAVAPRTPRYSSTTASTSIALRLYTLNRIWFFSRSDKVQLLPQDARIEQVLDPDADPGDLVAVRRADAAPGGPDPGRAQVALDDAVQRPVVRHDQVGVGREQQPRTGHPALGQPVDLGEQHLRVDDHAVADHRNAAWGEHPGRHQVQRELPAIRENHRVARVVAALIPHDIVDPLTEQVRDLALALVAPLGADEHDRWHVSAFRGMSPVDARFPRDVRLTREALGNRGGRLTWTL